MKTVAFVWDNFGPMHADRCEAAQTSLAPDWRVVGIEQFAQSHEYEWVPEDGIGYEKVTLFAKAGRQKNILIKASAIIGALRQTKAQAVFLCNWDRPEVFLAALYARLSGRSVFVMGCSKFDDLPRAVWREALKSLFYMPYQGGIASGERSVDYLRFMGVPKDHLAYPYNTLSVTRIQNMSGSEPAPEGINIQDRHFTIVARFVEKKNLTMALEAYALYCETVTEPRPLHLCGSGALESNLRAKVKNLALENNVVFRGFLQTADIAKVLSQSYALILPSTEEQFGNVVIEAQAMGLPVLISDQCGARDHLVRNAINGFTFEPDNPHGLSFFMSTLHNNVKLWRAMCFAAVKSASKGDVSAFAEAVTKLIDPNHKKASNEA